MEGVQSFTPEASRNDIPAVGGGLLAAPSFRYDVFVSYSHHDQEWVQDCLLPRLQSEHLKICIDVLSDTGELVGILYGADATKSYVVPIEPILRELDMQLVTE